MSLPAESEPERQGRLLLLDNGSEVQPKRVQLQRTKGWRKPDGAVVVARPSRWGNPFRLNTRSGLARVPALNGQPWEYEGRISADGMQHDYQHPDGHWTRHTVRYLTAAEAVECYRALLWGGGFPLDFTHRGGYYRTATQAVAELRGKDLACWCPLDQPCHADVLLEVANPLPWDGPYDYDADQGEWVCQAHGAPNCRQSETCKRWGALAPIGAQI